MLKIKELYIDLQQRLKYLESEDAKEMYGIDLEGRKKETIQIMVAVGEIILDEIYPKSITQKWLIENAKPESSLNLSFYIGGYRLFIDKLCNNQRMQYIT